MTGAQKLGVTVFLIIVTVIVIMGLAVLNAGGMAGHEWTEKEICVQPGDSLYAYACSYCPTDVNREEWMQRVREINHMKNSNLYAGDRITVIVTEE